MTTISPTTLAPQAQTDRAQLHKAAQSFEAILVKQMLTAAHASSFGGKLFDSQGLQTFNAMQDERFAQITAESGTLGFAKMIEAQMAKRLGTDISGGASTGSARAGLSAESITRPAQPEPVEGSSAIPAARGVNNGL